MKIIKDISHNQVIAQFLKANISSPRFQKELEDHIKSKSIDPEIINNPNLQNPIENSQRKQLFHSYGGNDNDGHMFDDFPEDISWKRIILTKPELASIQYINYDYWNELSNQTRYVKVGAEQVRQNREVFDVSNQQYWNALDAIKLKHSFSPPILVTHNPNQKVVVIDGHLRLTAYLLDPRHAPNKLEAIMGISPHFSSWNLY